MVVWKKGLPSLTWLPAARCTSSDACCRAFRGVFPQHKTKRGKEWINFQSLKNRYHMNFWSRKAEWSWRCCDRWRRWSPISAAAPEEKCQQQGSNEDGEGADCGDHNLWSHVHVPQQGLWNGQGTFHQKELCFEAKAKGDGPLCF